MRLHRTSLPLFGAMTSVLLLATTSATAVMTDGATTTLGNGSVSTFADVDDDGTPRVIGARIEAAALDGLPAVPNGADRCVDLDGNGTIEAQECEGDYELRLPLPLEVAGREDIPFKWVMLNWNPHGHPPAPWQVGHFDLHFYMIPEAELDQIGLGTCGIFMDCEAFKRAVAPVPAKYVHPDHVNVEAAVGRMGNHLIDSKTPELGDPATPFTHTWIFGAYDGRIIFEEVMLTRDHLLSKESGCHEIKQPEAWQAAGWYPTSYCIRYDADAEMHEVTMEDFVLREASE